MDPKTERRLQRMENKIDWLIQCLAPCANAYHFEPTKEERPDLWNPEDSQEAEAKKKHIKKHSKLPPKEKAERIAELTEKAWQDKRKR